MSESETPLQKRTKIRALTEREMKLSGADYDTAYRRVAMFNPGLFDGEPPHCPHIPGFKSVVSELNNVSNSMAKKSTVIPPRIQSAQRPEPKGQTAGEKFRLLVMAAMKTYGVSYNEGWQTVSRSDEGKHLLDLMIRPTAGPNMRQFGFGGVSGGSAEYNTRHGMVDPKTGKPNPPSAGPMALIDNPKLKKKITD